MREVCPMGFVSFGAGTFFEQEMLRFSNSEKEVS